MNYVTSFWNAIFLMTVAVSFCAFNASGATVNVQEVAPTYVGFVYGECSDNPPPLPPSPMCQPTIYKKTTKLHTTKVKPKISQKRQRKWSELYFRYCKIIIRLTAVQYIVTTSVLAYRGSTFITYAYPLLSQALKRGILPPENSHEY